MTLSLRVGLLVLQLRQLRQSKPQLLTIFGRLVSPHYIKTPNNRYFRLIERRDDDLGVYMYWMLRLTKNGKYEVLRRLDPRYCEVLDELHISAHNNVRNLASKIAKQ
jgi:hypothetical protein